MDLSRAVELAPRVWWVGSMLPEDAFQCHVYLVEQGDQSVLIDPGSAMVADEVIDKIEQVVGLRNVRWLVCSHADPDILGALPALVSAGLHPQAAIVTHWRDEALIQHTGTPLPFWRIEDHEWRLPLRDRTLSFVFTPYAHFAGSFCAFDEVSGTLFSSDLFGGFTDDQDLFASSVDYFEGMRAFHEHYMPSREILSHSLEQLHELPIRRIAPQHGQVIPEDLVDPLFDQLQRLECGIYLLARSDPGLAFLLDASRTIRLVTEALVTNPQFAPVAVEIRHLAQEFLGVEDVTFWALAGASLLCFEKDDGFVGHVGVPPLDVRLALAGADSNQSGRVALPLRTSGTRQVAGVMVLEAPSVLRIDTRMRSLLDQVGTLVEAGLEREVLRRVADLDREAFYQQAVHDPLTGLHNRLFLADAARRLCAIDDRNGGGSVAALMLDADHFKAVNDRYGHAVGDLVLRHVAASISAAVRPEDLAVRYGGEEFLVLLAAVDESVARDVAERVRAAVAVPSGGEPSVTISVGLAQRRPGEDVESLVRRADRALYRAKNSGRNRVDVDG